jgi:hypothetical protein
MAQAAQGVERPADRKAAAAVPKSKKGRMKFAAS